MVLYRATSPTISLYCPASQFPDNSPNELLRVTFETPSGCVDSSTYKDPAHGDTCSEWVGYVCRGHSYSKQLISNCPRACGACTVLTPLPTPAPTRTPTFLAPRPPAPTPAPTSPRT